MHAADFPKHAVQRADNPPSRVGYSTWIFITFVVMAVALTYVWSHIHMTELEYQIAREITRKEQFVEEQKRLKVELATLKSPQRIETIAREKLQMIYPERKQVILLK